MNDLVERIDDRLADFTRDKRVLILSLMAVLIGAMSAVVACANSKRKISGSGTSDATYRRS